MSKRTNRLERINDKRSYYQRRQVSPLLPDNANNGYKCLEGADFKNDYGDEDILTEITSASDIPSSGTMTIGGTTVTGYTNHPFITNVTASGSGVTLTWSTEPPFGSNLWDVKTKPTRKQKATVEKIYKDIENIGERAT